jgi:uncharacterized protein (TIGR00255 family)
MTGFGSVRSEKDGNTISIDIKCLNSKFMDINIRLPKEVQENEADIRKKITEKFGRGKVQMSVELNIHSKISDSDIIDQELFGVYFKSLEALADKHNADKNDIFRLALHMPDVIKNGDEAVTDDLWKWINENITLAIQKADKFRIDEGNTLMEQFTSSLTLLFEALEEVENMDAQRRERMAKKLHDALKEIKEKVRIDENRYEQELIYYLEKIDISEEKVRLKSHLDYFKSTLEEKESNGKRLQFISQEIGREINTIGSKANDASLQKIVVGMKDELEKIKEQSLNVL